MWLTFFWSFVHWEIVYLSKLKLKWINLIIESNLFIFFIFILFIMIYFLKFKFPLNLHQNKHLIVTFPLINYLLLLLFLPKSNMIAPCSNHILYRYQTFFLQLFFMEPKTNLLYFYFYQICHLLNLNLCLSLINIFILFYPLKIT